MQLIQTGMTEFSGITYTPEAYAFATTMPSRPLDSPATTALCQERTHQSIMKLREYQRRLEIALKRCSLVPDEATSHDDEALEEEAVEVVVNDPDENAVEDDICLQSSSASSSSSSSSEEDSEVES